VDINERRREKETERFWSFNDIGDSFTKGEGEVGQKRSASSEGTISEKY
jgi:hypothetical protein